MVVPYTAFAPALRQAIISIEDKSFERNWGVNLVRAVGAGPPADGTLYRAAAEEG